jgi:hypothetical protein
MPKFVIERALPGAGSLTSDEAAIREHADRVGLPVSAVNKVTSVLDPTTGE